MRHLELTALIGGVVTLLLRSTWRKRKKLAIKTTKDEGWKNKNGCSRRWEGTCVCTQKNDASPCSPLQVKWSIQSHVCMCRLCPYKSMVNGGSLESLGRLTMCKMLTAGRKTKHRGGFNCELVMHRIGCHSLCIWLIYGHAWNRGQAYLPRNNQSITRCLMCLSLSFYGKRLEPTNTSSTCKVSAGRGDSI